VQSRAAGATATGRFSRPEEVADLILASCTSRSGGRPCRSLQVRRFPRHSRPKEL